MSSLSVTDVTGKIVVSRGAAAAQTQIDLSQLASGVYFLKIESGKKVKTIKIIKE
ncbi:T9SS type A sorting domain-containing protein [Flavobacterium sp. 3HN19-14]|uniref:T9SS type A sorting domain-containing protein n=1 Tax=Flavobacterium sp. 3HN19-14 TaxID=3448133 RepID=UPI003EDFA851